MDGMLRNYVSCRSVMQLQESFLNKGLGSALPEFRNQGIRNRAGGLFAMAAGRRAVVKAGVKQRGAAAHPVCCRGNVSIGLTSSGGTGPC